MEGSKKTTEEQIVEAISPEIIHMLENIMKIIDDNIKDIKKNVDSMSSSFDEMRTTMNDMLSSVKEMDTTMDRTVDFCDEILYLQMTEEARREYGTENYEKYVDRMVQEHKERYARKHQ